MSLSGFPMVAGRLRQLLDGVGPGALLERGVREETYRGDSASSRDGADSARRLADSVAEHLKGL